MSQELKVIQDLYDLMLWSMRHVEKFPRHHRYSLGNKIEDCLQRILYLLLEARYNKEVRYRSLSQVNIELQCLRFQFRLAKDLEIFPVKSHGFAAKCLESIGSQIGGWTEISR